MKLGYLLPILALVLAGCGDAYDDIASACQGNKAVKSLPEGKAEAYCACQTEMAKSKNYPPEILEAFAAKWRGEKPKNVPVKVEGEWFVFQLRCIKKTGVKM